MQNPTSSAWRALFAALVVLSFLARAAAQGASSSPEKAAASAPAPAPTLEQRVASLEAYLANGDPAAGLKDKAGVVPAGLTTPAAAVPGPAHNTWVMVSAALVIFMTLPGL